MAHIGFYKQADRDLQALGKQRQSTDNEALGWKSSLYYTSGMADKAEHHYNVQQCCSPYTYGTFLVGVLRDHRRYILLHINRWIVP